MQGIPLLKKNYLEIYLESLPLAFRRRAGG
jgi:hypothetical protein